MKNFYQAEFDNYRREQFVAEFGETPDLSGLTDLQQETIKDYFGLKGEPKSLREIARKRGRARQTIQFHKNRGLQLLRENVKKINRG